MIAGFAAVACSRTPPEPAPIPSASLAASSKISSAPTEKPSDRCIRPLADAAPPMPTAATGSACPTDPEPPHPMPRGWVAFLEGAKAPTVSVELALTPTDIEHGLMYRREMGANQGMLFALRERRVQTFWMHNTCIPLDMLFVDDDGTIVGIEEAAAPLTDAIRTCNCPSTWVLELNAGFARRHGIRPGQKVKLPDVRQ